MSPLSDFRFGLEQFFKKFLENKPVQTVDNQFSTIIVKNSKLLLSYKVLKDQVKYFVFFQKLVGKIYFHQFI